MPSSSSLFVSGTVSLANGDLPMLGRHAGLEAVDGSARVEVTIVGGRFLMEYLRYPTTFVTDRHELVRDARHWLSLLLGAEVVIGGVGLRSTVERAWMPMEAIWGLPVNDLGVDAETDAKWLAAILGRSPSLRWAARDLNEALLDQELAPLLMYRAVETCAMAVTGITRQLREQDWNEFHAAVGTSREDVAELLALSKAHRHGFRKAFTGEEFVRIGNTTRGFLVATARWVDKHTDWQDPLA